LWFNRAVLRTWTLLISLDLFALLLLALGLRALWSALV
jgi:hypothetical protein